MAHSFKVGNFLGRISLWDCLYWRVVPFLDLNLLRNQARQTNHSFLKVDLALTLLLSLYLLSLTYFCRTHFTVFSFLSLYTCFFMYAIFISVSHMMPWWVLFKCFRKTSCENLPCHKLSSCKVFQEIMLGLDLFCNSTSGYKFINLRLLLWFICLLWFCHGLPEGEIVRDIFDVIG